jgi:hypothetical protein
METANATELDRKSGGAQWRDLRLAIKGATALLEAGIEGRKSDRRASSFDDHILTVIMSGCYCFLL